MGDLFDFDVLVLPSQPSPPEDHETVVAIVPLRDIDLLNRFERRNQLAKKPGFAHPPIHSPTQAKYSP
jgi:hypothetical protein